MALVEKYHVVAATKAVNASATIYEGQIVSLNSSAEVVLCNVSNANTVPYGVAGDTKDTSASYMPGVASGWENRVSDYFDETSASSQMTVYHSGGEFATDMYYSNVASSSIMDPLYCLGGYLCTAATSTNSGIVGRLTLASASYPSGVPGVDTNGDQALSGAGPFNGTSLAGSNTYIEYKLVI